MNRPLLDRQEMSDLEDLAALLNAVICDLQLLQLHARARHTQEVIAETLARAHRGQEVVHRRRRYLDRAGCLAGKLQLLAVRAGDDPTNRALIDEMLVLLGRRTGT